MQLEIFRHLSLFINPTQLFILDMKCIGTQITYAALLRSSYFYLGDQLIAAFFA